ncbi:MAG: hypothetical protein WAW23_06315 [Candidatus Methanoperedens sp.]
MTMIYSFRFFFCTVCPDVLAKIIAEKCRINRINSIAKGELTCADSELIYRNMKILDYNAYAHNMY